MPCDSSGYSSNGMSYDEQKRLRQVEAILCGVLRALSPSPEHALAVFKLVDWKEAGVTPEQAYKWWAEHVAKDTSRRAAEDRKK